MSTIPVMIDCAEAGELLLVLTMMGTGMEMVFGKLGSWHLLYFYFRSFSFLFSFFIRRISTRTRDWFDCEIERRAMKLVNDLSVIILCNKCSQTMIDIAFLRVLPPRFSLRPTRSTLLWASRAHETGPRSPP